jgi:hypothetical protein
MYSLKQAEYNWYNSLTDHLIKAGFKQSQVDKCLFIRVDFIIKLPDPPRKWNMNRFPRLYVVSSHYRQY